MIITIPDHERLLPYLPTILYADDDATLRSAAVRVEAIPGQAWRVATWAGNTAMAFRNELASALLARDTGPSDWTSAIIPWHLLRAGYTRFHVAEKSLVASGPGTMGTVTYDWRDAVQPAQGFDAILPGGAPAFACTVGKAALVTQLKACVKETRGSYRIAKEVPDSALVILRASVPGSPYLHLSSVLGSERARLDLAIERGTRQVAAEAFTRAEDVRGVRSTVDAKKLLAILDAWNETRVRVEIRPGEHTPLVLRSAHAESPLAAMLAPMLS